MPPCQSQGYPTWARSFERHLRAENKSDRTVETYLEAARPSSTSTSKFNVGQFVGPAEGVRAPSQAVLTKASGSRAARRTSTTSSRAPRLRGGRPR